MKSVTHNQKNFLKSFSILMFAAFILQSCASKYAFSTSPVVPAAEGGVKVKKDGNNNYKVDGEVKRLAEPKRLTWTGLMSTNWNTSCNWNPAWVPDMTNGSVIIPSATNLPIIITGNIAPIKTIRINNAANLIIISGGVLNIR